MIIDGVISPEKPGSFTYTYDGKIMPVIFCEPILHKKEIKVEVK